MSSMEQDHLRSQDHLLDVFNDIRFKIITFVALKNVS